MAGREHRFDFWDVPELDKAPLYTFVYVGVKVQIVGKDYTQVSGGGFEIGG